MGLLFHFNFKGETSHTESSELNHAPGAATCGRCVLQGWGSPPAGWDVGRVRAGPRASAAADPDPRSARDWLHLCKPLTFPMVY